MDSEYEYTCYLADLEDHQNAVRVWEQDRLEATHSTLLCDDDTIKALWSDEDDGPF